MHAMLQHLLLKGQQAFEVQVGLLLSLANVQSSQPALSCLPRAAAKMVCNTI